MDMPANLCDVKEVVKRYLSEKQISPLFECLTAGLLHHEPLNAVQFLQECLRSMARYPDSIRWNTFVEQTPSEACMRVALADSVHTTDSYDNYLLPYSDEEHKVKTLQDDKIATSQLKVSDEDDQTSQLEVLGDDDQTSQLEVLCDGEQTSSEFQPSMFELLETSSLEEIELQAESEVQSTPQVQGDHDEIESTQHLGSDINLD